MAANETLSIPTLFGLLSYATDPNNDPLTVTAINGTALAQRVIAGASSLYDDVPEFCNSDGTTAVTATLTIQITNG